jgi:hypothetical protein
VLTEVKAYSSLPSVPTLLLSSTGRAETDLVQIRDIAGLDPVKASVNTSPYGSIDGAAHVGDSVLTRNIVLTIGMNPDWDDQTYESLRKLVYLYFMPKRPVQLVFYSDDMVPVKITGIVESAEANLFSKDPEMIVSIICPDPYFIALNPTVVTGQTIRPDGTKVDVDYDGNIEAGINLQITYVSGTAPSMIGIKIGDPTISNFNLDASVSAVKYFELSSVPGNKFVQNVFLDTGVIESLLSKLTRGKSDWPVLQPGVNELFVITDVGVQDWSLTYFERFGGL